MVVTLKIVMEQREYSALGKLAMKDLRSFPDEARFLIREGLSQRKMLSTDLSNDDAKRESQPPPELMPAKGKNG